MQSPRLTVVLLTAAALAACLQPAFGETTAEKGRAVLEANKAAVVTLVATLSVSYGGNERESETWANATIIDPTGLCVLSLTPLDPAAQFKRNDGSGREMTSKVQGLKILLSDETEVPAEIVLRDTELDLAFVRPVEKPEEPMAHVDLDNPGAPQLLDEVAIVGQLGKVARRAHAVMIERIESILDKPRTFYVVGEHRSRDVMCAAAFTLDGRFVGIGVFRSIRSKTQRGMGGDALVVIVPAEDIKEGAGQVPPFDE